MGREGQEAARFYRRTPQQASAVKMALFTRRENPPFYPNYQRYKPFLRRDFLEQCVYCERTEVYLGGEELFEVEHFRPASTFPHLSSAYPNLYYSCRGCNGHKSSKWPSE